MPIEQNKEKFEPDDWVMCIGWAGNHNILRGVVYKIARVDEYGYLYFYNYSNLGAFPPDQFAFYG